jgi:hypothetical protein
MNESERERTTHIDGGSSHPGCYEIRLKGHLDDRWTDWFEHLTITREDNGETRLSGAVVDQAALHGLLRKVRDLGMPLLSVILVDAAQANRAQANANADRNQSTKETNP